MLIAPKAMYSYLAPNPATNSSLFTKIGFFLLIYKKIVSRSEEKVFKIEIIKCWCGSLY